jgi:hypothetical protein
MNNSENGEWTEIVPKMRERSEPIDYTIDLGEKGVYYMTKGLYEFLMHHGYDIPEKFHSMYESGQLYNNTQEEINNNYNGTYGNNINNYAIRKTSGRLATNAFGAFKRNQKAKLLAKKTSAKAPNKSNRRTKKGKQSRNVGYRLQNTLNNAYNNYSNSFNNSAKDDFIKFWALNFLVKSILDSETIAEFEERLDQPLTAGEAAQNYDIIKYKNDNNIVIPSTQLRSYFETKIFLSKESVKELYDLFFEKQTKVEDDLPLIDVQSTNALVRYYYSGYNSNNDYYYERSNYSNLKDIYNFSPIVAALYKGNMDIFNKILTFNPSLETALIDIYKNFIVLNISLDKLIMLCSNIKSISDDTISKVSNYGKEGTYYRFLYDFEVALLYCDDFLKKKKTYVNEALQYIFEPETLNRFDIVSILNHLESKNIKPSKQILEETLLDVLSNTTISNLTDNINAVIEYLINKIGPNTSLDGEGNTVLMTLLRTRYPNEAGDVNHFISIVLSNPSFDPNRRNQLGETALAIAIRMGRKDVAERLMRDRRTNLEAKNVYGTKIINSLRRGIAAPNAAAMEAHAATLAAAPPPPPQENNFNWNAWANNEGPPPPANNNNNNNNITTGRTTRRNNYRNMMRTFERAIKPRVAMTMSAKRVGRRQAQVGPNLGRHIASFVPSAVVPNAVPPTPNNAVPPTPNNQ